MHWSSFYHTFLYWPEMRSAFAQLFQTGLKNTVILAVAGMAVAIVFGMILALMLLSSYRVVRAPARALVDILRGLPVILVVLIIGEGLPIAGIAIFGHATFLYAILALGVANGAYVAETFRSGIQSVERGQMEAARCLGLSHWQAMRLVVIPQGLRRILPALANQLILIVKESAFVFLLGLTGSQQELFSIGTNIDSTNGNLVGLVASGCIYLILVIPLSYGVNWMDRRLRLTTGRRTATTEADESAAALEDLTAQKGLQA
jgi:polar amino acid transport system permease protein